MLVELLFFSSIIILALTILVIVFRIKVYNRYAITLLSLYFLGIIILLSAFLFIKHGLAVRYNIFSLNTILFSMNSTTVLNYLYLRSIIKNENRFRMKDLWHLVPILFVLSWSLLYVDHSSLSIGKHSIIINPNNYIFFLNSSFYSYAVIYLFRLVHATYYLFCSWRMCILFFKNQRNKNRLKLMKAWALTFLGSRTIIFFCFSGVFIAVRFESFLLGDILITTVAIAALILSVFIFLNPNILLNISRINIQKGEKPILEEAVQTDLYEQITALINDQQLYLDPTFSLANLAKISKVSVVKIRDIMVKNGFENFSSYVNSFKVKLAEDLIRDNYLDSYSIETLSKQAGFNSEVTFYRVFKKKNGCTPKEFISKF